MYIYQHLSCECTSSSELNRILSQRAVSGVSLAIYGHVCVCVCVCVYTGIIAANVPRVNPVSGVSLAIYMYIYTYIYTYI